MTASDAAAAEAEGETVEDRIRVREVRVLSDDWYVLKKTTFDYRRRDGTWQTQNRETYDRGNGATILPYNRARRSVVLTPAIPLPRLRQRPWGRDAHRGVRGPAGPG